MRREAELVIHFAFRLALIAFATTLLQGVFSGGPFDATLESALLFGAVSYGLGYVLGLLTCQVVEEHVAKEFAESLAESDSVNEN